MGVKLSFKMTLVQSLTKNIVNLFHCNGNVYVLYLDELLTNDVKCLSIYKDDGYLWYRRFGHISMDLVSILSSQGLVRGLPKMSFEKKYLCDFNLETSFKPKHFLNKRKWFQLKKPLNSLLMDLGPRSTTSLGEKRYVFVIIGDYSGFNWILFLSQKDETFQEFANLFKKIWKLIPHCFFF